MMIEGSFDRRASVNVDVAPDLEDECRERPERVVMYWHHNVDTNPITRSGRAGMPDGVSDMVQIALLVGNSEC